MKKNNLTGQKFGRLTVVKETEERGHGGAIVWLCVCTCGKYTTVIGYSLRRGATRSCGCLQRETLKKMNTKHGDTWINGRKRIYGIWQGIKERCLNPNRKEFKRYGGRNILICSEWKNNYLAFKTWALANGYKESLIIHRIDNDGNYEPSNCRWVTRSENNKNRSKKYIKLSSIIKGLF